MLMNLHERSLGKSSREGLICTVERGIEIHCSTSSIWLLQTADFMYIVGAGPVLKTIPTLFVDIYTLVK